jgi:hypothetical protein
MPTITVKQAGGGNESTIAGALASIGTSAGAGAGYIVEVYDGTYTEGIINTLPSGISWNNPFILRVAPGNVATIRNSGENNIRLYGIGNPSIFSIIGGFILDGTNLYSDQVSFSAASSAPSSIRLLGCELVRTANENAIFIGPHAADIQIYSCIIHGGNFHTTANNAGHNHAIYQEGSNSIIQDCIIYNIPGFGIHQYSQESPSPSGNIYRRNVIHSFAQLSTTGCGILVGSGSNNKCYKNTVYNAYGLTGDGAIGIAVNGSNDQVYNNTVYNCSWIGLDATGSANALVKNNISYNNGQNTDFTGANGGVPPSSLNQSNNFLTDPSFIDAAHGDFHLQSISGAINYGTILDLSYIGSAPDAGAYELGGESDDEPPVPIPIPVDEPLPTSPSNPIVPRIWSENDGSIKDAYNTGIIGIEKDSSNQYLYTLTIPAGSLTTGNKLRIKATVHVAQAIPPDCSPCVPSTDPGEQTLSIIHDYAYTLGIPSGSLDGNVAGQMNYVRSLGNSKEEFIATVAHRSGFGTSYDYPAQIGARFNNGDFQVLRFAGTKGERVDPVSLPLGYEGHVFTTDVKCGRSGHSDEMGYLLVFDITAPGGLSALNYAYFNYEDNEVTFFTITGFAGGLRSWAKYGDELYGVRDDSGDPLGILKVMLENNNVGVVYPAGGKNYHEVFATTNYVWGLTTSGVEIVKLRKDTLEVITTYSISSISSANTFHIIDEKAAYIGTSGRQIYYLLFTDGTPRLIGTYPSASAAGGLMHFRNGYFYFVPHNNFFGSGYTGVLKVGPLLCPGTEIAIGG